MPTIKVHLQGTAPEEEMYLELPQRELDILVLLGSEWSTVSQIQKQQQDISAQPCVLVKPKKKGSPQTEKAQVEKVVMSISTIHTLLTRLERRGFVVKSESMEMVFGTRLRRVFYSSKFDKVEIITTKKSL